MEGVMCQPQSDLQEKWQRAAENREYVRRLLAEKQPAFAAAVRAAERRLDWELSLSSLTRRHRLCGLGRTWREPFDTPDVMIGRIRAAFAAGSAY
jgi:hypothetical protein